MIAVRHCYEVCDTVVTWEEGVGKGKKGENLYL